MAVRPAMQSVLNPPSQWSRTKRALSTQSLMKRNVSVAICVSRSVLSKWKGLCENDTEKKDKHNQKMEQLETEVSAKYSCGLIVIDRYLDYFTTIMEDRLWQVLAKPVFRWRNRSG